MMVKSKGFRMRPESKNKYTHFVKLQNTVRKR